MVLVHRTIACYWDDFIRKTFENAINLYFTCILYFGTFYFVFKINIGFKLFEIDFQ